MYAYEYMCVCMHSSHIKINAGGKGPNGFTYYFCELKSSHKFCGRHPKSKSTSMSQPAGVFRAVKVCSLCFLLPGKMNTQQTGLETPPTLTPGKSPKLQGPSTPGGGRLGRKRMQAGRWEGSPSSEASPMSKRLAGAFSSFFPPCPLTHHSSTPNLPFEEEQMEPLGPAMATTSH